VWSAAEQYSVMCSIVSTDSIRSSGVEVFVVDRRGKGRFRPQSPFDSEDGGVVIVRWVGYGRVAVSELFAAVEDRSPIGRGRGTGMENNRDALKRAPPGDTLRVVMAVECQMSAVRNRAKCSLPPKGILVTKFSRSSPPIIPGLYSPQGLKAPGRFL
jgi:hypothetical protein